MLIIKLGFSAQLDPEEYNPVFLSPQQRQYGDIAIRALESSPFEDVRRIQFGTMDLHGHPNEDGKYKLCQEIRPVFNSIIYEFNKRN